MTEESPRLQRKLKTAGWLIIGGLVIEATTLYWSNPTSFLSFIGAGGLLVMLGIALYLLAIVSR
ncbi:MAG TPA: hypothetical protein VNL14_18215 [Candidatus Acidoferrales bacterium]|nr:hypothetical protein [Candidatus Acidoferrales bacterium]